MRGRSYWLGVSCCDRGMERNGAQARICMEEFGVRADTSSAPGYRSGLLENIWDNRQWWSHIPQGAEQKAIAVFFAF